jgi:DNA repair protein RadA/Sms
MRRATNVLQMQCSPLFALLVVVVVSFDQQRAHAWNSVDTRPNLPAMVRRIAWWDSSNLAFAPIFHALPRKVLTLKAKRFGDEQEFEEEDDDDEDDEPPEIGDVSTFRRSSSATTFGWNKGRSSPATRKAMGKSSSSTANIHICGNCGSEFVKWMGRCPTCKEWNTLQEHAVTRQPAIEAPARPVFGGGAAQRPGSWLDNIYSDGAGGIGPVGNVPVRITSLTAKEKDGSQPVAARRIMIPDDDELNTVLGGGIMKGSLTLIGGDPGVGKSTLMLQVAGSVAHIATPTMGIGMGLPINHASSTSQQSGGGGPVWYVSGEENPEQIASRAVRLGIDEPELYLLRETHVDTLCEQIVSHHMKLPRYTKRSYNSDDDNEDDDDDGLINETGQKPLPLSLVVIDSIQTMVCDAGGASFAGGITQVRECVAMFLRLAKSTGIPIVLIGHVTKSGDVAGPRTVEHMVDCILYLEGTSESGSGLSNLRILRTSKNRFGSSDEVGVYEMTRGRLLPVSDPSSLFLAHRNDKEDAEGCAIAVSAE